MTISERNNRLKHLITCMKCEVSGKVCDDNCPTQYNAGNMGEIIENLEAISKALEQEPILDKIKQAREEMKECSYSLRCFNEDAFDEDERVVDLDNVLIILDKLIESEDK